MFKNLLKFKIVLFVIKRATIILLLYRVYTKEWRYFES